MESVFEQRLNDNGDNFDLFCAFCFNRITSYYLLCLYFVCVFQPKIVVLYNIIANKER